MAAIGPVNETMLPTAIDHVPTNVCRAVFTRQSKFAQKRPLTDDVRRLFVIETACCCTTGISGSDVMAYGRVPRASLSVDVSAHATAHDLRTFAAINCSAMK